MNILTSAVASFLMGEDAYKLLEVGEGESPGGWLDTGGSTSRRASILPTWRECTTWSGENPSLPAACR